MAAIFWFFQDLRINDNRALMAAYEYAAKTPNGAAKVVPLYILDQNNPWPIQGAQKWWLHESLLSLSNSLKSHGGKLVFRRGAPLKILEEIFKTSKIDSIFFSRAYEPYQIQLQTEVKALCDKFSIACKRYSGSLLQEPENTLNKQDKPFQVFTPYSKHFLQTLGAPVAKTFAKTFSFYKHAINTEKLSDWNLRPTAPNWAAPFNTLWQPGETGAIARVDHAIDQVIEHYDTGRDIPGESYTSRLSPHLHFGEISPATVWTKIVSRLPFETAYPFLRQLIWREFNYSLLVSWPHIDQQPFKEKFKHFQWQQDLTHLKAWQQGRTGYPIVDAGMRELYGTGWMHNRVRMICASFLTKHLQIHWHHGAKWFWDTLLDADLANNSAGWQWVAGCGADAAPYFRIFNPTLQGQKFDPSGIYVRRWVPELNSQSNKFIHEPYTSKNTNGKPTANSYPTPVVNHQHAREQALANYRALSTSV